MSWLFPPVLFWGCPSHACLPPRTSSSWLSSPLPGLCDLASVTFLGSASHLWPVHHLPHLHHPRFWAHSGLQGFVHGRLSFIVCTFSEGLLCARPCARHRVDGHCPRESTPRGDTWRLLDGTRACGKAAQGRGCREGVEMQPLPQQCQNYLKGEALGSPLRSHGWPVSEEVVPGTPSIRANPSQMPRSQIPVP